jgi:tetratricopeptide (TPR) repeat protein
MAIKTTTLTEKLGGFSFLAPRIDRAEEAELYLKRARIAAGEERYDVARVFGEKARQLDPNNLEILFCLARIFETGFADRDGALQLYQKIIAFSGYDSSNRYCAAAREALAELATATPND